MRLLHQEQPGIGLDLRVVQRALGERDCGALRMQDALPGRVALLAGTLQRGVQQPDSQLITLAEPQRQQRQQRSVGLRTARQASRERLLHFFHRGRSGLSPQKLLIGDMDARHGLETRVAPGLIPKALQLRGEADAQLRESRRDRQQLRAELERALGVDRPQLLGQRRQRVGRGLR